MLKERMKVFADEWLTGAATGKQFNAGAAYGHAGYSMQGVNPYANASKLLRHPDVQEYIRKQLDQLSMSATEVLLRFTAIARNEAGEILTLVTNPSTGEEMLRVDPAKVVELKQYIKNFSYDSNGYPKVEFHDAVDALKQIMRIHGMAKDGINLLGQGGGPAVVHVKFVDPQDEQLQAQVEAAAETVDVESFDEFDEFPD